MRHGPTGWGVLPRWGRGVIHAVGIGNDCKLGDRVRSIDGAEYEGEIVSLADGHAIVLADGPVDGVRLGDRMELLSTGNLAPGR